MTLWICNVCKKEGTTCYTFSEEEPDSCTQRHGSNDDQDGSDWKKAAPKATPYPGASS